jgi:cellobiose-specific phosphotransferase system component IIA
MQWFEEMECIMVQLIIYDGSCFQKVHRYIKSHKGLNNMEEMQKFEKMQCIMVQLIIYDGSSIQKVHRYIKSHKGLK